jgi:hypothetical protein
MPYLAVVSPIASMNVETPSSASRPPNQLRAAGSGDNQSKRRTHPSNNDISDNPDLSEKEQDDVKKTLSIVKDIRDGIRINAVKEKRKVSETEIIHRLATVTKHRGEMLEDKALVGQPIQSAWPVVEQFYTDEHQDTETQTRVMAYNNRGRGLAMSEAIEKTYQEQAVKGELMRWEQYGVPLGVRILLA